MSSDIGVVAYLVDGITATGRVAFAGWLTKETFAENCYVAKERYPNWKGSGYLIGIEYLQPIESLAESFDMIQRGDKDNTVIEVKEIG